MIKKNSVLYDTQKQFPQKKFIFKLTSAFPWLLYFSLIRSFLNGAMPNSKNSRVTPGFSAIIGKNVFCENAYLNDTVIFDYAPVDIGKGTIFSGKNTLITSTHTFENFNIVEAKPIYIGKNVWVTHRCIILGGVTIGDNSVIGAGSVVTKDIPENVFAAGNPCKVIKAIQRTPA